MTLRVVAAAEDSEFGRGALETFLQDALVSRSRPGRGCRHDPETAQDFIAFLRASFSTKT